MQDFYSIDVEVTKVEFEGKKFNAYKSYTKDGKKITVKFTKDVKNAPEENGKVTFKAGCGNITKNTRFPTLWINSIEKFVPYEKKVQDLDEYFGESDEK